MGQNRIFYRLNLYRPLHFVDDIWSCSGHWSRIESILKNNIYLFVASGLILMIIYGSFDPSHHHFPQCPFRWATGLLCPGCGSQRAIHAAMHGQFVESFRLNYLFLPAVVYALGGWAISGLFPRRWQKLRSRYYGSTAAYISLAIILLYWIGRNIFQPDQLS